MEVCGYSYNLNIFNGFNCNKYLFKASGAKEIIHNFVDCKRIWIYLQMVLLYVFNI